MTLTKAERLLKNLDKKIKGKLADETRGSIYLSIQAKMAEKRLLETAKQIQKEGIV